LPPMPTPATDVDCFAGAQAANARVVPKASPPSSRERLLRLTPLRVDRLGFTAGKFTTK
jgi:hypothetical protein